MLPCRPPFFGQLSPKIFLPFRVSGLQRIMQVFSISCFAFALFRATPAIAEQTITYISQGNAYFAPSGTVTSLFVNSADRHSGSWVSASASNSIDPGMTVGDNLNQRIGLGTPLATDADTIVLQPNRSQAKAKSETSIFDVSGQSCAGTTISYASPCANHGDCNSHSDRDSKTATELGVVTAIGIALSYGGHDDQPAPSLYSPAPEASQSATLFLFGIGLSGLIVRAKRRPKGPE